MAEESAFSDIEEIHEVMLQYSPVHVCESDDPSDGWVTLRLDESTHVEEIEPLQTRPMYSLQELADSTMAISQDYVSNPSSVGHLLASDLLPFCRQEITSTSELLIRSPLPSGLTESSMDYSHLFVKEGQKDKEIRLAADQSLASDFPEFEEIDGNFDINSLDSDEAVDGSTQLYSGFPPLLTGNFHTLIDPSSEEFSAPSLNEASMKHSSSFQQHLDSMMTFDQNLNSDSSGIDGNHALISPDMAADCNNHSTESIQNQNTFSDECNCVKLQIGGEMEKSHHEEPITLPSESNKAANVRKRKNHGLFLENLPGGDVSSNKKFYCGQGAYEKEKLETGTVRNSEPEGSSTEGKEGHVDSMDDNLRTMSSTIAELNNTINLISAENISLRTRLSFFNQPAACSAKTGAISTGQPLGPLAVRLGKKVFSHKCISPTQIPGLLHLQGSIRNTIRFKSCQVSAEIFDTKRIAGVAAVGFCFIMMLCLPFNWRFSGSQNMKRSDIILWHGLKGSDMARNGRNFKLLDREIEHICKNASSANHGNPGREPHDSYGLSGKDLIIDSIEQRKTMVEKKIMGNLKRIQVTSLNICHSYRCRSGNLSAPTGVTAVPQNASKPSSLPGIIKFLKFDGSLTVPKVNARRRIAFYSAQQDQWKKGKNGQESNQVTLAVKTSRALQDLQSFKKTIVKVSKGFKKGEGQRLNKNAFRFPKALPTNRKVASTTKNITRLETSEFMQQQLSQEFAGKILSTGICTEMFRYKISPAPETHQANVSAYCKKATSNKRQCKANASCPLIKQSAVLSLPDTNQLLALRNIPQSSYNNEIAVGPAQSWADKQSCQHSRPRSSIVVSVLAGSHVQQDKSSKSLDGPDVLQIVVVVLIDGVNYVAYSCILPAAQGPKSQAVTG